MAGFPTPAERIAAHAEIIRETMGQMALIHAVDQLTAADMCNAVAVIERELNTIQMIVSGSVAVPLFTLEEVAARAKARANKAKTSNPLRIIEGGVS